jgi:hypothetical protein
VASVRIKRIINEATPSQDVNLVKIVKMELKKPNLSHPRAIPEEMMIMMTMIQTLQIPKTGTCAKTLRSFTI